MRTPNLFDEVQTDDALPARVRPCASCGGDAGEPDHRSRCDGRQGALYGPMGDVPYEVVSSTSAQAAGSIRSENLARLESLVFDAIRVKPQTCDALEASTGLSHQTASARIRGLVLRDRIEDSGQRAITSHGRRAVVWRVKPDGANRGA